MFYCHQEPRFREIKAAIEDRVADPATSAAADASPAATGASMTPGADATTESKRASH
jgi:hypothetical protein